MVTNIKPVDFEAFLARPENQDRSFELIDGEIVEKMPSGTHSTIQTLLAILFYMYFRNNPIGAAWTEFRIRLPHEKDHDLIPDVMILLKEGRTLPGDGPLPYMPDLVVEIKSRDDKLSKMWEKAQYYLAHGVKIVWLVQPEKRLVHVLTADTEFTLDESEILNGGDLLPGFQLPVKDLFSEENQWLGN